MTKLSMFLASVAFSLWLAPNLAAAQSSHAVTNPHGVDPYLSVLFRNVAQLFHAQLGLVSIAAGRSSIEVASNRRGFDIKNTDQRSGIEALALYAAVPDLVSAGMRLSRVDGRSTSSVTDGTSTLDSRTKSSDVNYTPFALATFAGCITLAAEYEFNTVYETPEARETNTLYFQRFLPSALYHRNNFEVGVSYKPTVLLREPFITHIETGTTTISGQVALAPTVSVGGYVRQYRSSQVDKEALKDNYEFEGATEAQLAAKLRVGAGLSYRTTSSATDEDATATTIPRWGPEAFVGYSLAPTNRFGVIYRGLYARRKIGEDSHKLLAHELEASAAIRF